MTSSETAGGVQVRLHRVWWTLLVVTVVVNWISLFVPALVDHPLTTNSGEIHAFIDVFGEANLPTWWSVGLLLLAAWLCGLTAVLSHRVARAESVGWWCAAVLLGALSLDDHAWLHERLDRVAKQFVTFDSFPFYWVIPGLVAGAVIAVALLLLAKRLSGRPRWFVVAGCGLLLGCALGIEVLQGLLIANRESGTLYVLTYHAEELGENIGVLLLIAAAALSLSIRRNADGFALRYRAAADRVPSTPTADREVAGTPSA